VSVKRMWILTHLNKYTGSSTWLIACGQERLSFSFHPPIQMLSTFLKWAPAGVVEGIFAETQGGEDR
jgi:hypothetical protein